MMCDDALRLEALAILAKGTPEQHEMLCRYLAHRLACDVCPRRLTVAEADRLREADLRVIEGDAR